MKRDMDLLRKILLTVERHEDDDSINNIQIDGCSYDKIAYHVYLLKEAGLIDAVISYGMGSIKVANYSIFKLTWKGHEFLDAARNDTIWAKAKEKISTMGGDIPFELVPPLLIEIAKKQMGL